MNSFSMPISIRWADIDANRHMRHSVYYDFAAAARVKLFSDRGLTTKMFEEWQIGPVLFREEAIFKREILLEDQVTLKVELSKATEDYSRWSFRNQFFKADGTLATIITIDAAWIDLRIRKLTKPNEFIRELFTTLPRTEDFQWTIPAAK